MDVHPGLLLWVSILVFSIQCKEREGTSRLLFSYAPEPCDGGNRLEMRRLPGFADASIERSPGDEKRWSGEGR